MFVIDYAESKDFSMTIFAHIFVSDWLSKYYYSMQLSNDLIIIILMKINFISPTVKGEN